jgi:peptidoglycan/xylan/chitin deacetylase (PgdA/CDA1 family)
VSYSTSILPKTREALSVMMNDLWSSNTPQNFWKCVPDLPLEAWELAYANSFQAMNFPKEISDIQELITLSLGEGQFGPDHWQLGRLKRMYYKFRRFMPRRIVTFIKVLNLMNIQRFVSLGWPVEDRYVNFQRKVMKELMSFAGVTEQGFIYFWPQGKRFSFVLTHDIESNIGFEHIAEIADLEENLGFRSSFNFVPEKYPVDEALLNELKGRGFEIGLHGLKHDGQLFFSKQTFMDRAVRMNQYIRKHDIVGFRAPYTHRHPDWMQALDIEYDLSFFDTDPFEPLPGGGMSIWPFRIGKFIELPYTLVQDSTLRHTLSEETPQKWLQKVDFIRTHHGMALLNSHPDYLVEPEMKKIYTDFLLAVKEIGDYWHALPRDVAAWWRKRETLTDREQPDEYMLASILLEKDEIHIQLPGKEGVSDAYFR